jgi:parallel beta-helix repeat protein
MDFMEKEARGRIVMKKIGFCLCLILLLVSAQYLTATDYFVANAGSDSNNGRSQQAAWRTIGKVNSSMGSFNPGDHIYFKGGDTFSDANLFITCQGTSGNPITFGSYGTGRPKFSSRAVQCGNGNGYITVDNLEISNPGGDGISFYKSNGWQYDVKITNCYVRNAGNVGIIIMSIDGYLIENCTVLNSYNGNIYAYGSNYPIRNGVIRGCTSYDAIQNDGICVHEGDRLEPCGPNHLIVNCTVHGNAEEGYDISDGSNVTIRNCVAYGDAYAGFILEGQNAVTIDGCIARDGHHGIHIGGSNVTIKNSLIYDNDYSQILIEPYTVVSGISIYNNTLVHPASGNSGAIIQAWGNFSNLNIKNNIIMTKNATYPTRLIGFGSGYSPSSANIKMDYNCYYHPGGSSGRFVVGSSTYSFSSWQSAYNHESHSMFTNPYLTNTAQNDYTLTSSSPCIDTGTNVGNSTAFGGVSRPQGGGYDIGAYEQGGGVTPLQAGATASPSSGQAPLTASFSGEAWGGSSPYSYRWTFGDGASSTAKNPSHTYSQPGTYTATFTVTDDDGDQNSDSVTIHVNDTQSLSAGIVASPTSGEAPLTVSFNGTATGGSPPYSYRWTSSDGNSTTQQNPTHTFNQPGTYNITLTVTDSSDNQDSASVSIQVSAPASQLSASAGASPMSGNAPLNVQFTGSTSGGTSPYSFRWTFGDGTSSTAKNPSHSYSQPGTYNATLTVTDSSDNQDSASVSIQASAPTPQPSVSAGASPMSGSAPLNVQFTGSASGGTSPYSFRWTFGDGGSSTQQNPSHTYSEPGTYTAAITVTDSNSQQKSASVTIQVSASVQNRVKLSLTVNTGQGSGGQGGTITPSAGIHIYDKGSIIGLKAKNKKGFRFSRWTGDIRDDAAGKKSTYINMSSDKNIAALFCSICGDVNGDGRLSPLDSQAVFDMFLGKNTNPTICQKENGDVNGDGTRMDPHISPADAQFIFSKYLGKKNLPCDCSYNVRTASALSPFGLSSEPFGLEQTANPERPAQDIHLGLDELLRVSETEIHLPVMINNPRDIDAFGFDLVYPADLLEFKGVAKTEMVKNFYQVEGNVTGEGVLRVGGYSVEAIADESGGELVILIFELKRKGVNDPQDIFFLQTFDDVETAYYVQPMKAHGTEKSKTYVRR